MTTETDALVERVRRRLAAETGPPTPARIAAAVRAEGGLPPGAGDALGLLHRLQDELLGAGPLADLLRDPAVTDVLVTAPDEVWADRGGGPERVPVRFADDAAVVGLVRRLVAPTGRRVDAARPWVDARLPDGTRLHAVLAPVSRRGTCVSLRTLRRQQLSLAELVAAGTLTPWLAAWLRALVRARLCAVVTGGTGSGKTTLLACLLRLVDPAERVVVVEDAAELRPALPHVVLLEARPPNVEGAGEVTVRDLVRQALRMRPDRLVVGEARGPEVADLLAAFNTGHDGGLTTLHANAPADLPARLAALGQAGGLDRAAVHAQAAAALHAVVHLRRGRDGRRAVTEVGVVRPDRDGLVVEPALRADGPGRAYGALAALVEERGVSPPRVPRAGR